MRLSDEGATLLSGTVVKIGGGFVNWEAHPPAGITFPNPCVADPAKADIFEVSPVDPVG